MDGRGGEEIFAMGAAGQVSTIVLSQEFCYVADALPCSLNVGAEIERHNLFVYV